jgi:O-acetylserine/cysteine efflux transporter
MERNRNRAVMALIAAGVLWGTTVPLSKVALEWLPAAWLTFARFGLACLILLTVSRTGIRAAFRPAILASGAIGYGGSVLLQNAGIETTSVSHAALLVGAVPVLVAIMTAVWHRRMARPLAWAGFGVSLAGVVLVTAGHSAGANTPGAGATMGDGLVLASVLLSATLMVAQPRLLRGRDPVAVTAVQFLGAAAGVLPVAMSSGGIAVPSGGQLVPVLATLALAVAGTLAPFTLFAYGQKRVPAEVAGAFVNIEPVVGAVAGVVVFGDPAGAGQLAGGLAILVGIAMSSWRAAGRAPASGAVRTRSEHSEVVRAAVRGTARARGEHGEAARQPARRAVLNQRASRPLARVLRPPLQHARSSHHVHLPGRRAPIRLASRRTRLRPGRLVGARRRLSARRDRPPLLRSQARGSLASRRSRPRRI